VKVGRLVRNRRHPNAGVGIIIEVHFSGVYAVALFENEGEQIIYPDEMEWLDACEDR